MACICPPEGPFKVKQTWREIIEREGNLCAAAQTDSRSYKADFGALFGDATRKIS